jgi:CheY-like chemotaxis protein
MWVESEVGVGSTFFFTLAVESVPSKPRPYLGTGLGHLAGKRLLVVDDNATSRRILTRLAAGWDMAARAASSGEEALGWLRANEAFDVAVIDMQMPAMDGGMLAVEIRRLRDAAQLPLIMLSSVGQGDLVIDRSLFAAHLSKPTKSAQLLEALVEALQARGAEDAPGFQPSDLVTAPVLHPERVLIAEDNVVNQKVALFMLAKMGYRADVAANGREALEALGRQPYDIVLMDVHMPEVDGIEATRQIRLANPAHRPWIIALTANAMYGDRELCLAAGMDDYVSKPIKPEEIGTAMGRAKPGLATA